MGYAHLDGQVEEQGRRMGHVTRDTTRCVIDIDTSTGQILLSQRWKYVWATSARLPAWTYAEQRRFHTLADRSVWATWSNRARLAVTGSSDFAQRFATRRCPVNLDISWVLSNHHWEVTVTKIPAGQFHPSEVFWNDRRIALGSRDYENQQRTSPTGVVREQPTVAHEFGHSFGNTGVLRRGDEYPKTSGPRSPHIADETSIMNIGSELRVRHFRHLIDDLNQMIPNTRFAVATLR